MAESKTNRSLESNEATASTGCPDCDSGFEFLTLREFFSRREFIKTAATATGVAAIGAIGLPTVVRAAEAVGSATDAAAARAATAKGAPETLVKQLYDSLKPEQAKAVAFDWDYVDPKRGLLRTRVANNWNVTDQMIASDFYTKDQQEIIRGIYEGLFQPDWVGKIDQQLQDDGKGYGKSQSIALFGKPGDGKFEMVMTGRHMTVRVDGRSNEHMAFGGPIFHGHAASGFNEEATHPGNVFWPQAVAANKIYEMLDGKQRKLALQSRLPDETAVSFRGGEGMFPGIPVPELSADQKEQLEKTLSLMLSFYQAQDIGDDGVWDNWRLEGPSFVWYFRGSPHVHLWINIGDDPAVATNS
jgi:hypothetical protein